MDMRRTSRALICAGSIAISAGPALAQSGAPAYDWSGAYAGATFGYTLVEFDGTYSFPVGAGPTIPFDALIQGAAIGALGGYSFQMGDWVFGPEVDLGYTDNEDISGIPGRMPAFDLGLHGHIRGRAGYLIEPKVLAYGAVGLAIANVEAVRIPAAGTPTSENSEVMLGLTLGGGVEFIAAGNMRVRFEYLWDNYFDQNFAAAGPVGGILFPALDADTMGHTFRFGVTYYFN